MEILRIETAAIGENVYLLINEQKETLIFDPGDEADYIQETITKLNLKPVAIALTHAHFDHIGAVDQLRDAYQIPVFIHALEASFLGDPAKNLSINRPFPEVRIKEANNLISEAGPLNLAGFTCRAAHIPGHSPGSLAYIFEEAGLAIVGDTIFKGSCGRTDLPGSTSQAELLAGIREHLMTLPDNVKLYPGHGPATTVSLEKATNPFLRGVY